MTREEILTAASDLFSSVGYLRASLRGIAAGAGVTHPALLHHFGGKLALFEAVMERRDFEEDAWVADLFARGVCGVDVVRSLVKRNAGKESEARLFVTLAAESVRADHPAHEYFARRYRRVIGIFSSSVEQAVSEGLLDESVSPESAARTLVALVDGLQLQWLMQADTPEIQVDIDAVLREFYSRYMKLDLTGP